MVILGFFGVWTVEHCTESRVTIHIRNRLMGSNPWARRTPTGFLFSLAQFYCTLNILLAQFYCTLKQVDRVL